MQGAAQDALWWARRQEAFAPRTVITRSFDGTAAARTTCAQSAVGVRAAEARAVAAEGEVQKNRCELRKLAATWRLAHNLAGFTAVLHEAAVDLRGILDPKRRASSTAPVAIGKIDADVKRFQPDVLLRFLEEDGCGANDSIKSAWQRDFETPVRDAYDNWGEIRTAALELLRTNPNSQAARIELATRINAERADMYIKLNAIDRKRDALTVELLSAWRFRTGGGRLPSALPRPF